MPPHMRTRSFHIAGLVVALVFPTCSWAMDMADGGKPAAASDPCAEMKAEKMKIQADRKAAESEITAQIAAMLAAPDKDKVNLMGAIIARMEAQEISIEARKDALEEKMMQAMRSSGKGMAMGCMMMMDMKGDKGSADMKDMKDMKGDKGSADAKGDKGSGDMKDMKGMDGKPGDASGGK